MNRKSQTIVIGAVILALTAVMGLLPLVFLLPLLFTCATQDIRMSLFAGASFGVISFVYSLTGASVIAVAFVQAPWIAIVPRIFVALAARGTFVLCKKLFKGDSKKSRILPYSISAGVGSLTNTVLVITLLVLFMKDTAYGDLTIMLYVPVMLTYGAIEFAISVVVVPPVAIQVSKALGKGLKIRTDKISKRENAETQLENAEEIKTGSMDN